MAERTRAQNIVLATLGTLALLYVAALIGGPVLEYLHGPSPETVLLKKLTDIGPIALVFVGVVVLILQRIGVLPTIRFQSVSTNPPTPAKTLRNLAIWIVIALFLVFLFNFLQATGTPALQDKGSPLSLLAGIFPVLLFIGIWILFLRQMHRRANNQKPDSTET